uniref:Carboxy-S-adenosyl-L-methionine synthase n=1 Tax=Candidatus Aschnera chinzeii TaxID=1485666 RepID=A0AAT9G4L1_9ENTR|nr:MAG: carboxy-S-adenosyl-L-methionine synthase CmoA [Candidatus Aschnera chinzeii]
MYKIFKTIKQDRLFNLSVANLGNWKFDKKVAAVFPSMVQRSIPGYINIITMIGMLAARYVKENSKIYDLGCSVGTAILSIQRNIKVKNCKIIAIDNSDAMIRLCKKYVYSNKSKIQIKIIQDDIFNVNISNASIVILNFTLQFIPIDMRQQLINRIYDGLIPGGILIMSEKFYFNNKVMNTLYCNMHYDYKKANGYSDLEIKQKKYMLKHMMYIDSINTHKNRLMLAGFRKYDLWFQCFNFGSILAFKD